MSGQTYDIVTIGGGVAASSFARAMAEKGFRILVLEREKEFKDRVRGEALVPWGVGEARALGIYDLLKETCAHEQRWFDVYLGPHQLMHRDLLATTPQQAPVCSFYHPRMQETLLTAAVKQGAEVRRGAVVTGLRYGPPTVTFQFEGQTNEVQARLIVVADGRVSAARKWAGFAVEHDPPSLMLAGLLLDDVSAAEDVNFILTNPRTYRAAFLFPQGDGRARAYFAYPVDAGYRLQGAADIPRFLHECVEAGAPAENYRGARAAGPLASFETADSWAPHPYRNGVALVGDAAASSDPSWGNGLALSLRSVRMLRDRLAMNPNWDEAGHQYAEDQDRVYDVIHSVTTWSRQIFMENTEEAEMRRAKALPLIAADPFRVPDHGIGGPDLPFDKELFRARFFGEV